MLDASQGKPAIRTGISPLDRDSGNPSINEGKPLES
jgi:hypothetical protein